MWGAVASSAAALGGAYLQYLGQRETNLRNLDAQDKANLMTQELANTAHRREVDDLRAAGLNPILSAGGSGAPTPTLQAATVENSLGGVANSATAVGRELSRALSTSTQLNNRSLELQNIEDAETLQARISSARQNAFAEAEEAKARYAQASFDRYVNEVIRDSTLVTTEHDRYARDKWARQILEAAFKDRANQNWRHNLESISHGVGAGAQVLNSARSIRDIRRAFRRRP